MVERPKSEADSGQGEIAFVLPREQMNTAAYLLVSSPNEVSPESVKLHCLENDFKAHLYRSTIQPANSAAFDAVFCDPSFYQNQDERHLFLVNRSGESGERVVISTIAIDWESHLQLLENVLEYIAAGVPRLAFVDSPAGDSDIDFIQSTARLAGISSREYQSSTRPPPAFGPFMTSTCCLHTGAWTMREHFGMAFLNRANSRSDMPLTFSACIT